MRRCKRNSSRLRIGFTSKRCKSSLPSVVAQTDALTRVPNRRAFDEHIETRVALGPSSSGHPGAAWMWITSRSSTMSMAIALVTRCCESSPIFCTRDFSRTGWLPDSGARSSQSFLDGIPVDKAKSLVERARIAIGERDMKFENKRLRVSASIGLAQYAQGQSIADWIQQADEALYRSKDTGRDCGHWMDGATPVRIEIGRRTASSSDCRDSKHEPDQATRGRLVESGSVQRRYNCSPESRTANSISELPDTRAAGSMFDHMRHRTQVGDLDRRDGDSLPRRDRRCRQLVPAASRTFHDARRGSHWQLADDSTLLICMPSVDEDMAMQRARQICRSAEAIGLDGRAFGPRPVSIGIVQAIASETFSGDCFTVDGRSRIKR